MTIVLLSEGRRRLEEWVERASKGEEILITRRGEVVARLVQHHPSNPGDPVDRAAGTSTLVERIRQRRAGLSLGDKVSIETMVEEGRR